MDGLLIDSEPLWREAEARVFNKVGVPLTPEMTSRTMGFRTDEVVDYWRHQYPWESPSSEEVCRQIEDAFLELLKETGAPKAGVHEAIAICEQLGLPMAIASSSSALIIDAVIEKLGISSKMKVIHSAEFEPYGKPHPAVYIAAAQKLGVRPHECLAFEDSVNGMVSAKAAKMRCIAIPEPEFRTDKRYGIADLVVGSLLDVTTDIVRSI